MLWNKGRPPTITRRGSTMAMVPSKVIRKSSQGKCYVCNKQGHCAKDCHSRKDQGNPKKKCPQANVTEVDDVLVMNLSVVVSEVNFIGGNTKEWWVDTGATHHVCSDKKMFSSYHIIDNGEQLCNTPNNFFLHDFFSWNLSFRCFMVHHEFIIIFRNYFSIKWNFRKIYPVR